MLDINQSTRAYITRTLWMLLAYEVIFQVGAVVLMHSLKLSSNSASAMIVSAACGVAIVITSTTTEFRTIAFRPLRRRISLISVVELLLALLAIQMLSGILDNLIEPILTQWLHLNIDEAVANASGSSTTFSMMLYTCLLAPLFEELLFRGYLLHRFLPFGEKYALVISSLLFGLMHMNFIQIPFAFCVGLVLAYVTRKYGLGWAITLHVLNNALFAELFGYIADLNAFLDQFISMVMVLGGIWGLIFLLTQIPLLKKWNRAHTGDNRNITRTLRSPLMLVIIGLTLVLTVLELL